MWLLITPTAISLTFAPLRFHTQEKGEYAKFLLTWALTDSPIFLKHPLSTPICWWWCYDSLLIFLQASGLPLCEEVIPDDRPRSALWSATKKGLQCRFHTDIVPFDWEPASLPFCPSYLLLSSTEASYSVFLESNNELGEWFSNHILQGPKSFAQSIWRAQ